jgi:membrane protein implicated in regulation of membrane protease activity
MVFPALDGRLAIFFFAVTAVASTFLWKRWGLGAPTPADDTVTLNRRGAQYAGRTGVALGDFSGNRGAILIDDTRWTAVTVDGSTPHAGDALAITGADGATLQVRSLP